MKALNQNELEEIVSLKQEAIEMFRQVQVMFHACFVGLMENDIRILDRVLDDENTITKTYNNLTGTAIESSKKHLRDEAKKKILNLVDIICAIERIGDCCVSLVERIEYKIREKLLFSEVAVQEYQDLHNRVEKTLSDTIELMKAEDKKRDENILERKSMLNELVDKYRANHIERSAKGICDEWARVRYLDMLDITQDVVYHCIEIAAKLKEE